MGVLGASMSTANGGLLAISSVISRNLIQREFLRTLLKRTGLMIENYYYNTNGLQFQLC